MRKHTTGADPAGSLDYDAILGASLGGGLMANALAALFAAGATLALLTVALPHSPKASVAGLLAIVADAFLVAGLLHWRATRVSRQLLRLTLAWGSTLIAGVAYFSGQSPSPLVFFFLWVFLYSAYFFTTRETAYEVLYAGIVFAAFLFARMSPGEVAEWWLVGMGSSLVAAVLVRFMRHRFELLITKLYDAARSDPLTKLTNRRGFRELLDLELERTRRGEGEMSVLVGDLDHFSEVNARAGQAVGDATLRRVAGLLDSGKRQLDGLARVGGEQFALILPDTGPHEAFAVAEQLRVELEQELAGDSVAITISFGLASYPEHGATAASILKAADSAVYAAKDAGRNRTVLYSDSLNGAGRGDGDSRDVAGERFVSVVIDLAEAVDLRFSGSARHSETVGRYAEAMARELGLPEKRVARVRLAGLLHDVGKVGVPDAILQKPDSLTDEEFEIIKRHPELGGQILEHPSLADVRAWVSAHHERPDGRGYPLGLAGEEIPLEAKILAVADAYEAMTSDRAYRAALGHAAARAELERCVDSQFDGSVVKALVALLDDEAARANALLAEL
jgi:diguanylate cyclase (GGDEF)-like protein/putative nucleotidyltransferase with HDIG domain